MRCSRSLGEGNYSHEELPSQSWERRQLYATLVSRGQTVARQIIVLHDEPNQHLEIMRQKHKCRSLKECTLTESIAGQILY